MTSPNKNLEELTARKESLFQQLTRMNDLVSQEELKEIEAEVQMVELAHLEKNFADLEKEIESAQGCTSDFDAFRTLIDAVKHCLRCKVQPQSNILEQKQQYSSLTTFSGDIGEWEVFLQQYNALIHSQPLPNAEKFSYLKAALSREPLAIVCQFEEDSYELAFSALLQRYNNPRRLANHYLNEILYYNHFTTKQQFTSYLEVHREATSRLKNLGIEDLADYLLFELCYRNLPLNQQKNFDRKDIGEMPSLEKLFDFVDNLARTEDQEDEEDEQQHPRVLIGVKDENTRCPNCKEEHSLLKCKSFTLLPLKARLSIVQQHQLCSQCLGDHSSPCQSTNTCSECRSRTHHTFLCENFSGSQTLNLKWDENEKVAPCASRVLLGTIKAQILDIWGNPHEVRVVCDSGSQGNIITQSLVSKLGLKQSSTPFKLLGISGNNSQVLGSADVTLQGYQDTSVSYTFNALILPSICGVKMPKATKTKLPPPICGLPLADPDFGSSKEVQVLLGAEAYAEILSTQQPTVIKEYPTAIRTIFGYILVGRVIPRDEADGVTLDKTSQPSGEVEDINPKKQKIGRNPTQNRDLLPPPTEFSDTYTQVVLENEDNDESNKKKPSY